jgi:hypothetical protein
VFVTSQDSPEVPELLDLARVEVEAPPEAVQ